MMYASKQPMTLEEIAQRAPSAVALAPHSSRSERYTYIPTSEVIKGMQGAGFQPFAATQSRCRDLERGDFTKHMIRFRRIQDLERLAVVGELVPEIVLVNAHDGTSAYKLMAGIWRFICANGAMVSDSTIESVNVKHKGDVVAEVINASMRIADQSGNVLETIQGWKQLQLTNGEQDAFAQSAHHLRFADSEGKINTPIVPSQLLHLRRTADAGNDLWKTFNRVQENVIKGDLHGRTPSHYENGEYVPSRRVSTREVKGIDQNVKLNRALWMLAENMAKLKSDGLLPTIDAEMVA